MTAERAFLFAAFAFAVLFCLLLPVTRADERLLEGVAIWAKPLKFALSTAIHFATFAVIIRLMFKMREAPGWLIVVALVSIGAAVFEVGYIAMQAARGEMSHFNTSTPFHATMFSLMAIGAVGVMLPAPVIAGLGISSFAQDLAPPVRVAIALGLGIGTILTLVTAFRLGANGGHFVGLHPVDGRVFPLTHWSLEVGDLRPAHFLATHMLQSVPLVGLVLVRLADPRLATAGVLGFTALWSACCIAVFLRALDRKPLLPIGI